MPITSNLNIGLPAAPLADDSALNGELQIIYNALRILAQALNDAGIPSGGVTPSPSVLDVANGGTGAATLTGIVKASGTSAFTAITSSTVGHVLKVTGANTYAFAAAGYGDVVGPAGAIANNVVLFDGATGKLIKDGGTLGSAAYTASTAYDVAGAAAAITPTTLGLVIGTNVQAYDADLTTWAGITPGTGVGTALAVAVGSAGAFVTFNGALGTPASGSVTNLTGTASININGTVGATTPSTGAFTDVYADGGFDATSPMRVGNGGSWWGFGRDYTDGSLAIYSTQAGGRVGTWQFGTKSLEMEGGLAIGSATAAASGIAFPATAVAVADVNTLDDYEEGTWTPTIADAVSGGNTSTTGTGYYTKVGRLTTFHFTISAISTVGLTAGNTLYIQGLPFVAVVYAGDGAGAVSLSNVAFSAYATVGTIGGQAAINLLKHTSAGAVATIKVSDVTSGSGVITGSFSFA